MSSTCPVCAFTEMPYKAVPYNICPCCGTEFGVDDRLESIPDIRRTWVAQGMPWFDDITEPPRGWNPVQQLLDAQLIDWLITPISLSPQTQNEIVTLTTQLILIPIGAAA